jgi:hypothetical protein
MPAPKISAAAAEPNNTPTHSMERFRAVDGSTDTVRIGHASRTRQPSRFDLADARTGLRPKDDMPAADRPEFRRFASGTGEGWSDPRRGACCRVGDLPRRGTRRTGASVPGDDHLGFRGTEGALQGDFSCCLPESPGVSFHRPRPRRSDSDVLVSQVHGSVVGGPPLNRPKDIPVC